VRVTHDNRPHRYIVGNYQTRLAVTLGKQWVWRLPWQRPRGGWWLGRVIVWWSR